MRAGPDGGSEWRLRSDLTPDGKPATPASSPAPDAPATVADGKLIVGQGENRMELSGQDIREIMRAKAEADMRATQIPASAESYQGPYRQI
jgi:hypothetical protein